MALAKLEPVKMDAARRTECLSGTRKDTLKVIVEWVNNQGSEQNILWLHGLAGSGKSTLSTTIASIFRSSSQLGAFIFFNRDVTERSDPTSIIRTLAYQLGSSSVNIGGPSWISTNDSDIDQTIKAESRGEGLYLLVTLKFE
jgi:energy-coupling factor transporter ATP-binding protein EcfA2